MHRGRRQLLQRLKLRPERPQQNQQLRPRHLLLQRRLALQGWGLYRCDQWLRQPLDRQHQQQHRRSPVRREHNDQRRRVHHRVREHHDLGVHRLQDNEFRCVRDQGHRASRVRDSRLECVRQQLRDKCVPARRQDQERRHREFHSVLADLDPVARVDRGQGVLAD